MMSVLISALAVLRGVLRSRVALHLEVLALRHQLQVLQRSRPRRLRIAKADRWLWAWLSNAWTGWRTALVIVRPETVLAWHRQGFRLFWTWKSRRRTGRAPVAADVRALIRTMARENPLWGAPRIHGELLKLGVEVSQATVAKYMARSTTSPSQSWRTFLANHAQQIAAADFFVVPTASARLLFVLVILAHERRRIVNVAVTPHPTAAWTAQQFREAFPWDQAPRYLIHDRDLAFQAVAPTPGTMGIEEVCTAPRSPWQNPFVERLIGSIRRECLDHVMVLTEAGLRTILKSYVTYYNDASYCPTSLCA
jgi:putative transposase